MPPWKKGRPHYVQYEFNGTWVNWSNHHSLTDARGQARAIREGTGRKTRVLPGHFSEQSHRSD